MATILQIVDSLHIGGLERVAVDLANGLTDVHTSMLCSTRIGGPLEQALSEKVERLVLGRTSRWDIGAANRCAAWAASKGVDLIHAHGSSLLFANLMLYRWPKRTVKPLVVWHDHFGRYATETRSALVYRLLTRSVAAVLSVNQPLRRWAINTLSLGPERCIYLPNSIDLDQYSATVSGVESQDESDAPADCPSPADCPVIVCVANFRAQKNHLLLVEAFARIGKEHPAKLHLLGAAVEPSVHQKVRDRVRALDIEDSVHFFGEIEDVSPFLLNADIGVLSSSSEGLPLALLEYGAASLGVVASAVGQIPEVLGPTVDTEVEADPSERCGVLVKPDDLDELIEGLKYLVLNAAERANLGSRLRRRVEANYSRQATLAQLNNIYSRLLSPT